MSRTINIDPDKVAKITHSRIRNILGKHHQINAAALTHILVEQCLRAGIMPDDLKKNIDETYKLWGEAQARHDAKAKPND